MKQLFKYTVELWFRHNDEKEFMEVTIIAENDESAKKLGKDTRRNIFKVEILKKEIHHATRL
jgi:hypothetical protein